jgi:hypothetical protein
VRLRHAAELLLLYVAWVEEVSPHLCARCPQVPMLRAHTDGGGRRGQDSLPRQGSLPGACPPAAAASPLPRRAAVTAQIGRSAGGTALLALPWLYAVGYEIDEQQAYPVQL